MGIADMCWMHRIRVGHIVNSYICQFYMVRVQTSFSAMYYLPRILTVDGFRIRLYVSWITAMLDLNTRSPGTC